MHFPNPFFPDLEHFFDFFEGQRGLLPFFCVLGSNFGGVFGLFWIFELVFEKKGSFLTKKSPKFKFSVLKKGKNRCPKTPILV